MSCGFFLSTKQHVFFFFSFGTTGSWKAIFAPSCNLNPDVITMDFTFAYVSEVCRFHVLSIVLTSRQKVRPTSKIPTVHLPLKPPNPCIRAYHHHEPLCFQENVLVLVLVQKGVSTAMLINLLLNSKMTPSFSKSLFRLVGAEYRTSMSYRNLGHPEY